jgi:hypothetical protein
MALVDRPDRLHDLALVGLVFIVFGILAAAASLAKMVLDQFFSLVW